jgi:hypothetical protein
MREAAEYLMDSDNASWQTFCMQYRLLNEYYATTNNMD